MRPHIAYLLAPLPPALTEANSRFKTRIISGRRRVEDDDDEVQLQLFSKILLNLEKDATFDALHAGLPFKWTETEPYDTVNPFGDFRQIDFKALWTFDLPNDILLYINRHHRAHIPLGVLRSSPVTLGDMESLGPPVPPLLHPTLDSAMPCWKPQIQVDERNSVFIYRILRDFDYQWRHILRNNYNTITLRVLARAIIRLSTLDFEIREETGSRHGVGGEWVYITELPAWEPFRTDIVPLGDVHVIVCHSIQDGLSKAKKHIASQQSIAAVKTTDYTHKRLDYIILSVKHIVLCRAIGPYELEHTAPQPLFNGNPDVEPPSKLALDYLLWAITPAVSLVNTPLLSLPVEVQDIILGYASVGPVAAAKTGCLLSLGTPFLWKDGPLEIRLEDVRMDRHQWSPVESQLWFPESKVGITYRGRA
ncbi:hypothetical protein K505DRAFT_380591 [Melanomma pulvis-pyrius CBS 109.77]|uniref:Uncharacterized protein n=1 Tax=Melanomma pulvis-pyrius CBS 109.77 TaxID=1314802 RepID=A0A6A6WPC8_9PLEO|nr:hypothetical protein K505DRAFT_380591 [Melanomma pulvis-pyrius CBS 109.77]